MKHVSLSYRGVAGTLRAKNRFRWQVFAFRGFRIRPGRRLLTRAVEAQSYDQAKRKARCASAKGRLDPTTSNRQNLPAKAVFRAQGPRCEVCGGRTRVDDPVVQPLSGRRPCRAVALGSATLSCSRAPASTARQGEARRSEATGRGVEATRTVFRARKTPNAASRL